MSTVPLYEHQRKAVEALAPGKILVGGVGTGKSRTSIAFYVEKIGKPIPLYIITTAKKRDDKEWEKECEPFKVKPEAIDSWNNIKKYVGVKGSFFILDEQRLVGGGAWVKSFLKIARVNKWILLTATPGDTWQDYIPVFIANGFYRNRTEFNAIHTVYKPYMKFPVVDHYENVGRLLRHRAEILVNMDYKKEAVKVDHVVNCDYDKALYRKVFKERFDVYENEPIVETGKLFYVIRKVVNSDVDRAVAVVQILQSYDKAIIFYNFTYELNILRSLAHQLDYDIGEWNGEVHSEIPKSKKWVYLCQYTAACEGWNCIETNVIIFYSQSYSYKTMVQAAGRIDRLNTPFKELHYYYLKSSAPIDLAISRALSRKKNFNERTYLAKIK